MFASMSPFSSPHRHPGAMYQRVGVETALASASAHHMVAMLFDGLMEALAQARGAMGKGDIEAKGRAIGRAVRIVEEGLKAGLNMREGGALAADLSDLYAYIELRLTQANLRNDMAALDECKRLIEPLREAWASIAPQAKEGARA
jgi:flagellar secretion chaperone FliS